MKRMTRIISLLLTVVMVLGLFPAAALADQGNLPFTDVTENDWFYDEVQYVYENGLMNGTDAATFAPGLSTTRGMIVTILWRMESMPEAAGEQFDDVDEDAFYADAVLWAAENGIVTGYGDGRFGPDAPVTREQLATILYHYAQYCKMDVSVGEDTNILSYNDAFEVSEYAFPALQWACGAGLIQGADGNLMPQGSATRAQVAAILSRFLEEDEETVGEEIVYEPEPEEPAPGGGEDETAADTDGDGLRDDLEDLFGTDKTKQDTDGDGLSDYVEVMMGTNPLSKDSDSDGVEDAQEDTDGDGIPNGEELAGGTDPAFEDTDFDGLTDSDEKNRYRTDPVKEDTDGDGASDGWEVEHGFDPKVYNKTFDLTYTADPGESEDTVTASVSISLSGEQAETLRIERVFDELLFPETMPGYMGSAYDFHVRGTFDTPATISFTFDPASVPADAVPTIYYFNEEEQKLEPLDTTVKGNVASAVTPHFSTYLLINRTVFDAAFSWLDVWDSEKNYTDVEVVLVIDDSGSMNGNDGSNQRLAVAKNLIDNLPQNGKVGIVSFASTTSILTSPLTEDKETAKSYLTTSYFHSSGGTKMYNAINSAFSLFESEKTTTLKIMVVLSDGATSDTSMHSGVISTANQKLVRIYTVGLGSSSSSYFNNYLKPLAENTGGKFYLASNAGELGEIYDDISKKIDIETDSDGDGLADYYESHLVAFNGVNMVCDKNNPDTDGDGLTDGQEVTLKYTYSPDKTKVLVYGKLICYPTKADSDGDGYGDYQDRHPLRWDVSDRDLVMCSSMSYSFLPTGELSSLSNSLVREVNARFRGAADVDELEDWSIVDTWYAYGGLQATAFKIDNNIIMAYRGTDEGVDWFNDATTYVFGLSTHTAGAKKFMKQVMKAYDGYDFYVTGHSLGGHLAYNAAAEGINYDKSAIEGVVCFNGLGLCIGLTLLGDVWDEAQLQKKDEVIRNYSVEGDPVSKGFLGFTTFHYGTTYTYKQSSGAKDAHDLYTFIENLGPYGR